MMSSRLFFIRGPPDFRCMEDIVWNTGKLVTVRGQDTREVFDIMVDISPNARLDLDLKLPFAKKRLTHIRHKVEFEMNQVVELLRGDPTSRRARILEADYHPYNIACILSVQFVIRDGAVMSKLFLRSSDLEDVLRYDIFATKALQQTIVDKLNEDYRLTPLTMGRMTVHIASAHLYVNKKNIEQFGE